MGYGYYLERTDKKGCPLIPLPVGTAGIGRDPNNNIALPAEERYVSGCHAMVSVELDRLIIQDLGSTNGTFVNGQRINERALAAGDVIGLGQSGPKFKVVLGGGEGGGIDKPNRNVDARTPAMPGDHNCDNCDNRGNNDNNGDDGNDDNAAYPPPRKNIGLLIMISAAVALIGGGGLLMIFIFRGHTTDSTPKSSIDKKGFFSAPAAPSSNITPNEYDILPSPAPTAPRRAASVEARIDAALRRFGETDYTLPGEMVERVAFHLDRFSGPMKRTISNYMARRDTYFPMIRRVFAEKNIPLDLAYVSMLESGLDPNALSHAGAKGLWQFMPQTARRYGLEVSAQRDDRTDPEKATYAAAAYFKDLIAIFGAKSAVMLCMAAYNAGETRVINALKRIDDPVQNRDFWYLYRRGWLAEETNEYIPQVIALIIISENPEEYGF